MNCQLTFLKFFYININIIYLIYLTLIYLTRVRLLLDVAKLQIGVSDENRAHDPLANILLLLVYIEKNKFVKVKEIQIYSNSFEDHSFV